MFGEKRKVTLRGQLMKGYMRVIVIFCGLSVFSIFALFTLRSSFHSMVEAEEGRVGVQGASIYLYDWSVQVSVAIQTGESFHGVLDSKSCAFGLWAQEHMDQKDLDPTIRNLINAASIPHEKLHEMAKNLIDLGRTNRTGALYVYREEMMPLTNQVVQYLQQIDQEYRKQTEEASSLFNTLFLANIIGILVTSFLILAGSTALASRIANQIAQPIVRVADWAKRLALGSMEMKFDREFEEMLEENCGNEVGDMIQAFYTMAMNIQDNVSVLKRVAEGDMTAFVNIRSQRDTLGKSLYRLVQANDSLFNEIVETAQNVAAGAGEIANASHALADSTTAQAGAVQKLSDNMQYACEMVETNNQMTQKASEITEHIKADAKESNEHMQTLVESVKQIQTASERISVVMKTIDDIAFETNILALNAAIEAARAGSAGKGFAVVADEVRALALKSTEAARESKKLIEDSIRQSKRGTRVAEESSRVFNTINDEIQQIIDLVDQVSDLSKRQLGSINKVNEEIALIAQAATSNAAISEESDAASHEMRHQAEVLREAMNRFKLRRRADHQAFIPEEKQDDQEFIRLANEAFHQREETGRYGQIYIDPAGRTMERTLWE